MDTKRLQVTFDMSTPGMALAFSPVPGCRPRTLEV